MSLLSPLQNYSLAPQKLNSLILVLFEKYVTYLERKCSKMVEEVSVAHEAILHSLLTASDRERGRPHLDPGVNSCRPRNASQPLLAQASSEGGVCDCTFTTVTTILTNVHPLFPRGLLILCQILLRLTWFQIRVFAQKFYQFVDGVSSHHRDFDDLLGKVRSRQNVGCLLTLLL